MTDSTSNPPLEMLNELSENIQDSKKSFFKRLGFKGGKFKLNNSQPFYAALGLVLLIIGAAVATYLSGGNQDLRQQAEVSPYNTCCLDNNGGYVRYPDIAFCLQHGTPVDDVYCTTCYGQGSDCSDNSDCCSPYVCNGLGKCDSCLAQGEACANQGGNDPCCDGSSCAKSYLPADLPINLYRCQVPSNPPNTSTPTPGQWQGCGSCDTCMAEDKSQCRISDLNECVWDTSCGASNPTATPGQGGPTNTPKPTSKPTNTPIPTSTPVGPTNTPSPDSADLELVKSVSNVNPKVGDTISFTLVLTNNGPATATNVVVEEMGLLNPATTGLQYIAGSAVPSSGSFNETSMLWSIPSISAGITETLTVNVQVISIGTGENSAQVKEVDQEDPDSTPGNFDPNNPDTDEDDDDTTDINPANPTPTATPGTSADLELYKTVNDPAPTVGESVTYTITLVNKGPDTASGIVVSDVVVPANGLEYLSHQADMGSFNPSTGVWTVGTLAANTGTTLKITALVISSGQIENLAQVTDVDQEDPDSNPGDNDGDDSDSTIINPVVPTATSTPAPGATATNTPAPTATPYITCNQSCASNSCAGDQNLVCVDISSSGSSADFRCRLATNISDPNCGNPVVTGAPIATLPPTGQNASTTLVLITAGVVVLVLGALGLLLLL